MNALAWFFLSLHGRVTRQEFWLGYVGIVVVALILARSLPHASDAIYFLPGDTPDNDAWRSELFSFGWPEYISLALTWPIIAIYAKRLHDLNLSAWWLAVAAGRHLRCGLERVQPTACGGLFPPSSRSRLSARQQRAESLRRRSARALARRDVGPRPLKTLPGPRRRRLKSEGTIERLSRSSPGDSNHINANLKNVIAGS